MDRFFARHGPKTIFFARFITGLRVFGALFAGISRLRWPTFLVYNASGAVVWATAVGITGYLFGSSWERLEKWIGRATMVTLALVIVSVVLWVKRRGTKRDASVA
jgi:membrane protein DedA with SNARE-associated domain